MATQDYPENLQPDLASDTTLTPKINLLTMFRLGLFQMGLGIMAVLTLGVLNRVMIDELAVPATITAVTIAMHQFVAPARVWFGQLSDARTLWGYHRTGYVWIGTLLFTMVAFLALQIVWQLGGSFQATGLSWQTYGWSVLLGLVFVGYGLALSASSTPFAALLVDISEEETRSKLVGIVWSMLTLGIAIGGITSKILLRPLEQEVPLATVQASINGLFVIVPLIVCSLAFLATVGVEKRYSYYAQRSQLVDREDSITLGRALRILTASRQTGFFFIFLLVLSISLFMQEPVLEPYGGEVFGLSIGETSLFNTFWGIGTLVGLSTTGLFLLPRIGKRRTIIWGCGTAAVTFLLIVLAGILQNPDFLKLTLFLFGLAAGAATAGAINLMLDLTAAETAGTFIGAWGLAQAIARGLAVVTGGTLLDLGKQLFGSNLVPAYGVVFGLQAVGMILAIALLKRIDVQEFRTNAKQAIAAVLEHEIE